MLAGFEVAYRRAASRMRAASTPVMRSARSGGIWAAKFGEAVEPMGPFGDERAVVEVLGDDDVGHGERQRTIGAGRS